MYVTTIAATVTLHSCFRDGFGRALSFTFCLSFTLCESVSQRAAKEGVMECTSDDHLPMSNVVAASELPAGRAN
jgi:hypothetical protein